MKKIDLVLPVYNEEAVIKNVLEETMRFLQKEYEVYHIIVVDDGSTDRSPGIIRDISRQNKNITFIRHEKNRGYGENSLRHC